MEHTGRIPLICTHRRGPYGYKSLKILSNVFADAFFCTLFGLTVLRYVFTIIHYNKLLAAIFWVQELPSVHVINLSSTLENTRKAQHK